MNIEKATDERQPDRRTSSAAAKPPAPENPAPTKPERETNLPEHITAQPVVNPSASAMVFNGPVFFGFSADDTAALLQRFSTSSESFK